MSWHGDFGFPEVQMKAVYVSRGVATVYHLYGEAFHQDLRVHQEQ